MHRCDSAEREVWIVRKWLCERNLCRLGMFQIKVATPAVWEKDAPWEVYPAAFCTRAGGMERPYGVWRYRALAYQLGALTSPRYVDVN
jgi:hypothetical protein